MHTELSLPPEESLTCAADSFTGLYTDYSLIQQLYVALVVLSPPPVIPLPSEKKYRSAASPETPLDLPDIRKSSASVDLTFVVPAFNEVPRLPTMLSKTMQHIKSPACRGRTCEIIVVDDGSTDGTSDLALQLAKKYKPCEIRVVTLEANLGKGGAVRHGMLHSRGRRLLMVDADGASRVEDLELLWDEMNRISPDDTPAIVIGSRAHLVKTDLVVKVRHRFRSDYSCLNA